MNNIFDNTYFTVTLPLTDEELEALSNSKYSHLLKSYNDHSNAIYVESVDCELQVCFDNASHDSYFMLITNTYCKDGCFDSVSEHIDFDLVTARHYERAALAYITEGMAKVQQRIND